MKKIILLLAFFAIGLTTLMAQTREITGKITSADDGGVMPGVSVSVKGTSLGTITDMDGMYRLRIPTDAKTLVFSFVGMETMELALGTQLVYNAQLKSQDISVDEVVIVGYGIQTKREISGSIATVKGESINKLPVQTFDMALQGKAAGVTVTVPNAVLGNPPVVRIRGYNSISASSSPLYIVDGVPVFTGDLGRTAAPVNPLGDINPSDIESIEVLKDASATAIYGSRAANGVILITTKRGSLGKVSVTYDASMGYSSPYRLYDLMNAEQYVTTKNKARENISLAAAYFLNNDADGKLIDTDWNDVVYRTGFQHSHSLAISGANPTTNYMFSAGYSNNEGIIRTNSLERKNFRLNIEHKLNKAITLGANAAYTNVFTNAPQTGSIAGGNFATAGAGRLAFVTAPNVPIFLPNGDYNIDIPGNRIGLMNNTQPVGFFHPQFVFDKNYNNSQSDRIIATVYGNVNIMKGLFFRTSYGVDYNLIESKTFWHPLHGDGRTNGGEAFNYFDRRSRWNWTNTLNYQTTLMSKLNLKFLLGSEEQYTKFNGWSGRKSGLSDTFFTDYQGSFTTPQQPPTALLSENFFTSFFGRFNADYDKRFFVEASARRDGFSGLSANNKYGNFGGASVMWNISNENFFKNSSLAANISDLRIKASTGKVGNISGVSNFASLFLYGAGTYNGNSTLFFNQAGNADLEWETSTKFDIGLAWAVLKDRIQFELNYFKNDIDGLMLNVPQSPSKGIPDNVLPMNVGSMTNKGYEFIVNSTNIRTKKLLWTSSMNFNFLKNEVTSLAEGVPFIVGVTQLETTNRTVVGQPLGNIWGVQTDGVDPATGRRVFIRRDKNVTTGEVTTKRVFFDFSKPAAQRWVNEDGTFSRPIDISNDGVVLGSPIPKLFGGFDNNLSYGNFDFNLGLTFALDFYVYNGSKAGLRDQRNWNNSAEVAETYWKNPGDITDIPKPIWGDNISNGSSMVLSQNVEKGDFLKVRSIGLGYSLKNDFIKKANISSIRVYTQIYNAYVFTKYTGADPEISSSGDTNLAPGVDRNTVPQARTISFGMNLVF
ncbi:MAG: SusC/RagA family TonB-linked outer membrane protein [Bacteroidota bacterium]|nr:SusC/RagA family TonB-linked outer membrane protein [Bacteroidota bacterium]